MPTAWRPRCASSSSHTRAPASGRGPHRAFSRRRPARLTRRVRPDFGPRGEYYVNRLSHSAQATRQGWAERHRFATPNADRMQTACRPRCASSFSHTRAPASGRRPHRAFSRRRPARLTRRVRPDFGPRGEYYVNRLSHSAQATRQGWAERLRFATPNADRMRPHGDRDAHRVPPTHEPQLEGVGRIAPFRAGGRHASRGAFDPISGLAVSIM